MKHRPFTVWTGADSLVRFNGACVIWRCRGTTAASVLRDTQGCTAEPSMKALAL